ncbi:LysM domain-containing protein [Nannocystis exedens]|uniref:LysM domain-containing protein n=1 Tax=Nannocystis exedens TaxID=54 RepID=A0A1I2DKF9_9BACT|nr:penicillin-insensitive murein endopeptidase [Nannocystis exedens]PCC69091.1 peptidoglycan-binding protein LysM [Nannocystis exedens]SFE80928.1 LysM domain-containing protein [Nannocystis exedens]
MADGPVFKVISPDGDERRVAFKGPEMQVGSSVDSNLVLGGHGVSGKHCRISMRGDKLIVTDRGSRNGTYINSRRCVEPTEFGPGDRLSVGAYVLEIADDDRDRKIEQKLKFEPVALARGEDEQRAAEQRRLARYAREWVDHGRARRLLLHGRDLALAEGWMAVPAQRAEVEAEPLLREFVGASMRAHMIRRAVQFTTAGVLLGALAIFLFKRPEAAQPEPPPATPTAAVDDQVVERTGYSGQAAREEWIEHQVSPGETFEDIARYYEVSPVLLQQWNGGVTTLVPDMKLKVRTTRPPRPPLVQEYYTVGEGEDWLAVANLYSTSVDKLRQFNPTAPDRLKGGEELTLWIDAGQFGAKTPNPDDLPIFIVPEGASSVGGVTSGTLVNPVQLLPSALADVRCASHAYATNYTLSQLLRGLSEFRAQGFTNQVMIADLSLKDGGGYGRHKSHQSGRDADIWLQVKRKRYLDGCKNCSTTSCRPEPEEVDWRTTWRFIRALHSTGAVQEIFLSHWLQEELHKAAVAEGETPAELKKLIQWPRPKGTPALVMHSDGHIHHIHVRFKCDPTDTACSNAK